MRAYAIRRFLLIIPTLIILTFILFFMFRFVPGSVLDLMVLQHEIDTTSEIPVDRKALEHMLGLDVPVPVQSAHWRWGFLHGDFGQS